MTEYLHAFSDLRIEAESIIDLDDDRVLVLSRHTARGKLSGVPIEHEIGDLFSGGNARTTRDRASSSRRASEGASDEAARPHG